jgi:hypothetical protein
MIRKTQEGLFELNNDLIDANILEANASELSQTLEVAEEALLTEASRHRTAKNAARILVAKGIGFVIPTAAQKRILLVAFAKKNKVIYGKAFDIIKVIGQVDLDSREDVEKQLARIVLYEVKSTSKNNVASDFGKYFFALSTAELLVAQNLKAHYKFVFVNTKTKEHLELTLSEIFAKAKGIYPVWSIMF